MSKKGLTINTDLTLGSGPLTIPQLSTPSNPSSGFNKIYTKNDNKVYSLSSGGIETQVGSGTTPINNGVLKNYLTAYTSSTSSGTPNTGNGDLEFGSTTGWSLGNIGSLTNNLPTGTPTFGSGASGNLSISAVSSGQLAGNYSLSYVSSAATTQGDMLASNAFFIDTEDQAKVLTWSFYYKAVSNSTNANWSGTNSNSLAVAIYDVTNSSWLTSTANFGMTQSSGVGFVTGTCQTNSTTTQLRIVVYNANATSGAITVYFDDFNIGPQTKSFGVPVTDWVNQGAMSAPRSTSGYVFTITSSSVTAGAVYSNNGQTFTVSLTIASSTTLTCSGSGTPTTSGTLTLVSGTGPSTISFSSRTINIPVFGTVATNNLWTRRVGGDLEVRLEYSQTAAGTSGSGDYLFFLVPSIYSIDLNKVTSYILPAGKVSTNDVGCHTHSDGTNMFTGSVHVYDSNQVRFQFNNTASTGYISGTAYGLATTATSYICTFKVPIVGWSSNVQMSNDTDTRTLNARYHSATATVTSSYSDVSWTTQEDDTHGILSGATITIPVSGKYDFTGQLFLGGTGALNNTADVQLLKNGATSIAESQFVYAGAVTASVSVPFNFQGVIANAGDTFKIQIKSAATTPVITASTTENYIQVKRLPGSLVIAASEAINARYFASSTAITGSLATVVWTTKDFDSHNQMSSGQYTIQSPGKYQINSSLLISFGATPSNTTILDIQIQKNGVAISENAGTAIAAAQLNHQISVNDIISCLPGDIIRIQCSVNGGTPSIATSNTANYFSIARVG
jgi:hypothetical protein